MLGGVKTVKGGALYDNAMIIYKGGGVLKNLSFPVYMFNGCRYIV